MGRLALRRSGQRYIGDESCTAVGKARPNSQPKKPPTVSGAIGTGGGRKHIIAVIATATTLRARRGISD